MSPIVSLRRRTEPANEAWLHRLIGQMASRRDPPDVEPAEASYRRALAMAEELGMRPLVAHCHLGLGTLYRPMGKRGEEARKHLTMATRMYGEMDMAFWLQQAEAEMAMTNLA